MSERLTLAVPSKGRMAEPALELCQAAGLRFEDHTVEMKPGSFINIPAHKRHRVEWATPDEPTIWLAVHYGGGDRAAL